MASDLLRVKFGFGTAENEPVFLLYFYRQEFRKVEPISYFSTAFRLLIFPFGFYVYLHGHGESLDPRSV